MSETVDVVLIGGGVMSATLGTLLKELQPDWKIVAFERLGDVAQESSNPWNNAGTGHSALCELNYMPNPDDPAKAVDINEQFQVSRQMWVSLIDRGILSAPETFINSTPHMTFVRGEKDVEYLRKRYETLKEQPLFAGMEYSEDSRVINQWAPLLMQKRRAGEPFAATRIPAGTDVDFGAVTHQLFDHLTANGVDLRLDHEVKKLRKRSDGTWDIRFRNLAGKTPGTLNARFVFVGAGGWAIKLLQSAKIPEIKGYGVFPIGGQFLKTSDPKLVAKHRAKVYSQAAVGAPPMSVPHLDARMVDGEGSLMFGPFATFSPKFLKQGKLFDIVQQVRLGNIGSMLKVGATNLSLVKYLVGELLKSRAKKLDGLREFMPTAEDGDWELIQAGQRAQVMKGGKLQFGTEVVSSSDGSLAGLLGASPGASTAVPIMLGLLEKCFPNEFPAWKPELQKLVPTLGTSLNDDPALTEETVAASAERLGIQR